MPQFPHRFVGPRGSSVGRTRVPRRLLVVGGFAAFACVAALWGGLLGGAAVAQPLAGAQGNGVFSQVTMPAGQQTTIAPGGSGHPFGDMYTSPDLNAELDNNKVPVGVFRPVQARGAPTTPTGAGRKIQVSVSNPVLISSVNKVSDNLWETSGASDGTTVFMSGNWDDEFSTDGVHFSAVNPYNMMKGTGDTFCCDQIVQYAPQVDRFIWLLQGLPNPKTGQNVDRLAVSSPATLRASGALTWTHWDFTAKLIGKPGLWFDYPDLAIGKRDLIWTTNVIGSGDSVLFRIPLAKLAAGSGFTGQYYLQPGQMRPAQQTGGKTYWARFVDTSTLQFYWAAEGQTATHSADVSIPSVPTDNWSIKLPDGSEWLDPVTAHTKLNTSLQSGTLARGKVYFAWSAARTGSGKKIWAQPHIEIAVINAAKASLDHMQYIWSPTHGWAWPALTTNSKGQVGVAANYGGGDLYAYPAVGILTPKQFKRVAQGPGGVSSAGGHYITVRPHYPGGTCFAAFQFFEYPIGKTNNPLYTIFGRKSQACGGS